MRADIAHPDRERIVVADEAQRPQPARSSRRVSSMASVVWASRPSNGIADQEMPLAAREGLQQHLVLARAAASGRAAPPAIRARRRAARCQCGWSAIMRAHALGEVGRERELAAAPGRHLGVRAGGARETSTSSSVTPSKRQTWPAKTKVSPGVQHLEEALLDLADLAAAARRPTRWPRADEPHLEHRRARRWRRRSAGGAGRSAALRTRQRPSWPFTIGGSGRRSSAHSRRSRRNRRPASKSSQVRSRVGRRRCGPRRRASAGRRARSRRSP